jgi:hypothetical protein
VDIKQQMIAWTARVAIGLGAFAALSIALGFVLHHKSAKSDFCRPGLHGVVGRMGGGKTLLMTLAALHCMKKGRPVFANYKVTGATQLKSWADVVAVPIGSLVLLDEVHLWWPSTAYKVPPDLAAWCSQLRKLQITCIWSSQDWAFVAKRLRLLTFTCWFATRAPMGGHVYKCYDAYDMGSGRRKAPPLSTMVIKRPKEVMAAYDTLELVQGGCSWDD